MKKLLVFILVLSVLFVTSCGKNTDNNTSETVHAGTQTEQKYEKFESVEELKSRFNNAAISSVDTNSDNMVLYYPEMLIEGYDLLFIEMDSYYIFYYYMPIEMITNNSECIFDYNVGFVVSVSIEESDGNAMEILSNQLGIGISDDGTIYDEKNNNLIVPIGNTVYDITFPESYTGARTVNTVFTIKSVVIE